MNRLELRAVRERYGYSIRQVAQKADISHPYLQQLENGSRVLTENLQNKIMNALYALKQAEVRGKKN